MTKHLLTIALLGGTLTALGADPFTADTASLMKREPAPEWFRDAKFGIYFHWGVYSVPAFGNEWYPCHMFETNRAEYRHHVATYGDPAQFDYTDFIPQFKAEQFNAEAWADLFQQAGARFAGPVAEHHDNFAMWDSQVTPWNAKQMGPKRDITGELEKAIRARGMRFITTFHHEKCGIWEQSPGKVVGHYAAVKKNFPGLLQDPKLAEFYGAVPREQYLKLWLDKLVEVIDRYQPDLIWHDAWMNEIPEAVRNQYLAHYFNAAAKWEREVVVTVKGLDLPREIAVEDFEKGRADNLTPYPWLTDDTISRGSWCFTRDLSIKDADVVIDTFIDIVSKNGQLLLNISPMADGTIPQNQRDVLLAMGEWLGVNGEAIYATRPWLTYGEGPTRMKKGGHFVGDLTYGAEDIRYTRSKDGTTLYAILLGTPEPGPITLSAVRAKPGPGARVRLLGASDAVAFAVNQDGMLVLTPPALATDGPNRFAVAFKIEGFDLSLNPVASQPAIVLDARQALIEGTEMKLEERTGGHNLGFWNNPAEQVHWLLHIPAAGTYRFKLQSASLEPSAIRLAGLGSSAALAADVKASGDWGKPVFSTLGEVVFEQAGVHHVTLQAGQPAQWKPINVWQITAEQLR
jgi:alpha-L-fucosidase